MGESHSSEKKASAEHRQKLVMSLRTRDIILSHEHKLAVKLSDLQIFPNEYGAMHLWDEAVVAARFSLLNHGFFRAKRVLELGSGTGLVGAVLALHTKAKEISLNEEKKEVLELININLKKNGVEVKTVYQYALHEYAMFKSDFDLVFVSKAENLKDPNLLFRNFNHFLKDGGEAVIILSEANLTALEAIKNAAIEAGNYELNYERLSTEEYSLSPLFNVAQAEIDFPGLMSKTFLAALLKKKSGLPVSESRPGLSIEEPSLSAPSVPHPIPPPPCDDQVSQIQNQRPSHP